MLDQANLIPAPPMLDMLVMQLESALSVDMPAPAYVKESAQTFIDSLKRWQREGSN